MWTLAISYGSSTPAVVPRGTTAGVLDPYEIANVHISSTPP